MPVAQSRSTFQGYPVQRSGVRRSAGLRPDFGYIDLDIAHFKRLVIQKPGLIQWKDPKNFSGGITIQAFEKASPPAAKGGTVSQAPPPLNPLPEAGLFPVGDVLMATRFGQEETPFILHDVYIAPGGLEEISEDLDDPVSHTRGQWRIPITDIRAFWDYGVLAQTLNRRLDGGNFDPVTVESGEPFSMSRVVRFLLSQLPGSLEVDVNSLGTLDESRPPENVLGEMSPARDALAKVLDRAGIDLILTRENRAAFVRKNSPIPPRRFFTGVGVLSREIPRQSYERASLTLSARPPLVQVIGKRRIREIEVAYVPIYQDTDGKFYPLEELSRRWGYPMRELNRAVFVGSERAFANLPGRLTRALFDKHLPRGFSRGDGQRYFERVRILLKWAYRGYGPAHMFLGRRTKEGVVKGITEKELTRLPYLPAQEFMHNTDDTLEGIRLSQPQVRAYTVRQAFFSGRERFKPGATLGKQLPGERFIPDNRTGKLPSDGILLQIGEGEIAEPGSPTPGKVTAFDELDDAVAASLRQMQDDIADRESAFDGMLKQVDDKQAELFGLDARAEEAAALAAEGILKRIQLDFSGTGYFFPTEIFVKPKDEAAANVAYDELKRIMQKLSKDQDDIARAKAKLEQSRQAIRDVYDKLEGLAGWVNQPRGLVAEGEYSFDRQTGILLFSEVTGIMSEVFSPTRENVEIETDGKVTVRHGYEIDSNSAADWTSPAFMADPDGGTEPVFLGLSRPTGVKAATERDPNLRLYEDVDGNPLNLVQVVAQARARAQAVTEPRVSNGRIYEMAGFQLAEPISGEVQYLYDGDQAQTIVAINVPSARLRLGNRKLKGLTITETLNIQELLQ